MSSTSWHLQHNRARLQIGSLAATVDLTNPAGGLSLLRVADSHVADAAILALTVPSRTKGPGLPLLETHVRAADLVAVYEQSESWPIRVDALWRAERNDDSEAFLAAVELVVSVRTSSLDSRPELAVRTIVPAEEVLRLMGTDPAGCNTLTLPVDSSCELDAAEGPGCLVLRVAGGQLSYVEMVHPADFRRTVLDGTSARDGRVCATHRLFVQTLEKGVILRGRVRGLWLRREDDLRLAAEAYLAFAAEEPPLGT